MQENATSAEVASPERVLILTPSPIGVLGLEFIDGVVGKLEIVPIGARRKAFKPFADLKLGDRSETVDEAIGRLSEFMAGARRRLEIDYDLEFTEIDNFTRRVLTETARIPYGRTRTYQQVATSIGRSGAYRQVLATLTTNPLPLIIPCHRVVPSRAGVGSYVAATAKKEWLLRMEKQEA